MFKAAAAAAELEAIGVEAEIGVDRLAEGVEVTGATGAVAGGTVAEDIGTTGEGVGAASLSAGAATGVRNSGQRGSI